MHLRFSFCAQLFVFKIITMDTVGKNVYRKIICLFHITADFLFNFQQISLYHHTDMILPTFELQTEQLFKASDRELKRNFR